MTAISLPEKKKPSQVAQELTPWPMSACSLGRLSQRALAPRGDDEGPGVDGLLAEIEGEGPLGEVDGVEVRHPQLGAEADRLLLHVLDQLGALDAFRPAGKVLDQGGDRELSARLVALQHQGLEVCPCRVDGSSQARASGAQDDSVACRVFAHKLP